jgi:hypothetical protein
LFKFIHIWSVWEAKNQILNLPSFSNAVCSIDKDIINDNSLLCTSNSTLFDDNHLNNNETKQINKKIYIYTCIVHVLSMFIYVLLIIVWKLFCYQTAKSPPPIFQVHFCWIQRHTVAQIDFFFILKVANIRCFIQIAVEIFHNIIRI